MRFKDFQKQAFALAFLLGLAGCGSEEETPGNENPIRVLQPQAESRFQATDTVKIITESDYARYAGNLSAIYSADSGKTWDLVLSAPHNKTGIARDTFPFVAKDYGFSAGQSVKLEMKEYGATGIRVPIGFIHFD